MAKKKTVNVIVFWERFFFFGEKSRLALIYILLVFLPVLSIPISLQEEHVLLTNTNFSPLAQMETAVTNLVFLFVFVI